MHEFIPPSLIKEILDHTNIINVISEYIKVKKIGKNYYALCPFHQENTPSFTINSEKQYFYCFGCKIHGNIIDFLMQYNHLTFLDSINELANITGINIRDNDSKKITTTYHQKTQLYYTTEKVGQLYFNNIKSKNSKIAQLYLNNRNIHTNTINDFNIGFCNNQLFLSKYIKNKKIIKNLIKIGIIIHKNDIHQYDRFYNRIIFPIKNQYGQITGFGGRSLNKDSTKYINSPQSIIFNKSYQLYGIENIKNYKCLQYILVVEGYFDVISLTQFNIKNVVAILGTAITKYQINILFKFTNHIIFCYDGDKAGRKASWNTIKIIFSYINHIRNIQFIFLPEGEDPSSIIHKEGEKKFKNRIQNAKNIINCFFKKIIQKNNLSSIYNIANMLENIIPLIHSIPNVYIREYVTKNLGYKIGIVDKNQLQNIVKKKKYYTIKNTLKITNTHILLSLIIQNPYLSNIIPFKIHELKKINIPNISMFLNILIICKKYHNINTGQIIEFYRKNNMFDTIKKLAYWNNLIDHKNIHHVFIDLIKRIYNIALQRKYKQLIIKDRLKNLNQNEKKILWTINQVLSKIT